jgi:WhiB family redox-sensing transcriptional regulator
MTMTALALEEKDQEKVRDAASTALWTGVTRYLPTLPTSLDEQFVATVLTRVLDEFVDEVLEGIDQASTDTTHAIARCADGQGTLTHLFFSDDEFDIARAKAICSRCRLAPTCLEGALERSEAYGVWGGELLIDGVIVAVKRGRGRPPKTPRPVLVVDEVPVPPHLVA